jgi:uncharacterized protein YfdQ (DUF2303 family)
VSMADNRTENDAVIELARSARVESTFLEGSEHVLEVVLPPEHQHRLVDLERYQPWPRRKSGRIELHDAASFGDYVTRHRVEATTTLYADHEHATVVGVINDAGGDEDQPGWGDHRATLKLKHTKPWLLWTGEDSDSMTQSEFAEHIEQGLADIVEPSAAAMYELAQTFQARLGATFRQSGRLADGRRALHFEEQIEASAGEQGDLTIPKEIRLLVAPYEGGRAYELVARLRFRIREAKLTLSYHLVRPEDVRKAAFDEAVTAIEAATSVKAFRGLPPVRP